MAAHSNRSPSPLSSRPSNPNPRNSENNSTTRRSFSGNNPFAKPSVLTNPRRFDPITPANSPSDFSRRRSVGKEGTGSYLKDCEEKENDEKDHILKASKLQSPAKGSKNFMSPTISAASKFTPSPRKKVLVERNDPVRTSISLSDGKAMFFSTMSSNVSEDLESKSEMSYHQNQKTESSLDFNVGDSEKKKAVPEGHLVSKPSKKVTFSDVPSDSQHATESQSESVITDSDSLNLDSVTTDSDSLKLESSLKNKVVPPSIAPLDADPSLPPYDPKTNYLSPRPQFLHYKPNPRIEILLNKEKGLDSDEFMRLEDSLMAEIMPDDFSDSEGTEESQTEDSQKEEMEAIASADMIRGFSDSEGTEESQSEDSQKEEMEAIASADMVIGVEEIETDSHLSEPSESLPVSTIVTNAIFEEDFVKKNEKKPWAISRLMCFSLLLMLFIACLSISVTRSPSSDGFVLKDLSLSDLSNFYQQSRAKVNFDRFATHVNQLSVGSVSFIFKLANELGKGEKQGPLQFMNLSDLQKNTWNEEHFLNNEAIKEIVENLEEDELEEDLDTEMDSSEEEEYADEKFDERFDTLEDVLVTETDAFGEAYAEIDSDENFEKGCATQEDILITEEMSPDSVKLAESESEYSQDIQSQREAVSSINTVQWNEQNSADQSAAIPKDQETELETAIEVASDRAETEKSHARVDTISLESPPSEDNSFARHAMGISTLFAALLAVAALIYHYKRNPSLGNVVQADPMLSKQTGYGFTGTNHIHQEKEFSKNWQSELDVLGGESCPSEMSSSFHKSASYSKKEMRGANEVQSSERKTKKYYKRESLASSSDFSTESPSYGSFTTYERIPIKHANGDEEIITPVRRSSRIRYHQVTSP